MNYDSAFVMTIDGMPVSGAGTLDVVNPATGAVFAQAPDCSRTQLDDAVAAARRAFPAWAATPIEDRRAHLIAAADAMLAHIDGLSQLLTREQGKPHADAQLEIQAASMFLRNTASFDLPVRINERTAERTSETRRVPIGVVGAIAPWNFPIMLAMLKFGPALLTGNTLVLKPSPLTPLSTLKLGEIFRDLLPAGVFNIIVGSDDVGPWLTEHPGIDKVSFTGSTQTGRRVMRSAADTLKRVTLELGGNDPAIVLGDIDVDAMAEKLFWAAFRNNGQVCIATKRMYVHRDVHEPLKKALVAYASSIKVGDGSEQGTRLGPVQNRAQYERVVGLIDDAKKQGYDLLTGGDIASGPGYFVPVTIIDNPPENSRIVQEEQFGPILPLLPFDDIEDAIERANASEYGLAASVWSADEEQAIAIAQRIKSGTVWVNETQYLSAFSAFCGHRQSGVGIESGEDGLLEYTLTQTVVVKRDRAR